jgi:flavin-dependent thymidylate synthase
MKVTLLTATPEALDVLLFTKNTRLTMSGAGLDTVRGWSPEKKEEELRYMRNTIQSSWEFVDYVFAIEGVTRAFTHQLVRHRVGTSFAQQAQRVVNMEGFEYLATGDDLLNNPEQHDSETWTPRAALFNGSFRTPGAEAYHGGMIAINAAYTKMIEAGVKSQDARGILPTNVLTNIVFKANLRTLHDMALKRLCVKAQGEFQDVFKALVEAVVAEHPWADDFLRVQCAWNGTCLFPSLPVSDCHVKGVVYNPVTGRRYDNAEVLHPTGSFGTYPIPPATTEEIYQLHRATRTEIQPVVQV